MFARISATSAARILAGALLVAVCVASLAHTSTSFAENAADGEAAWTSAAFEPATPTGTDDVTDEQPTVADATDEQPPVADTIDGNEPPCGDTDDPCEPDEGDAAQEPAGEREGDDATDGDEPPGSDTDDPCEPDEGDASQEPADETAGDGAIDDSEAQGEADAADDGEAAAKEGEAEKKEGEDDREEVVLPASRNLFADTPADAWYVTGGYLDYVVEAGLMSGYSGVDAFGPDDCLTRGQLVTILYRYATGSVGAGGSVSHFADVATGMFYTAAVEWAYQEGVSTGYVGTGCFGPNDSITREDMAVMISRFASLCGVDGCAGSISSFPDAGHVSPYALGGMRWCVGNGIIGGSLEGGALWLNPGQTATRAEAAKMLTVLCRDVLGGSGLQGPGWSYGALDKSVDYLPCGGTVTVAPQTSAPGLTYKYGWYSSDGSWASSATDDAEFTFYLGSVGTFTLWCQATDASGVSMLRSTTVEVWGLGEVSISKEGPLTPTSTVTVRTTVVNDPGGLAFNFSWSCNGGTRSGSTVQETGETTPSSSGTLRLAGEDGHYVFSVEATDRYGNKAGARMADTVYGCANAQPCASIRAAASTQYGNEDGTVYEDAVLAAGGRLCYDQRTYWCGAYVWWSMVKAGYGYAYCGGKPIVEPRLALAYYDSLGLYDPDIRNVKPGDIVFQKHISCDPSYSAGHILYCVDVDEGGYYAFDGNSGPCHERYYTWSYYASVGCAHVVY